VAAHVPVLVVTGYSGSGKTTLIERLLLELRGRGHRLGVVKHVGHPIAQDGPGKDSERFWAAGAEAVAMVGRARTLVMLRDADWGDLQALADMLPVDLVLAEGFKSTTTWARLIVLGQQPDAALQLGEGREVLAIVGQAEAGADRPSYLPDDVAGIADRIEGWLRRPQAAPPG